MPVDLPSSSPEIEALLASALKSRAPQIRDESASLTLANVRRLLEEDLGLQKFELDPHKSLIRKLVDEVLVASNGSEVQEQEEKEVHEGNDLDERNGEGNVSSKKQQKKPSARQKREEEAASDSLDVEIPDETSNKKKRKKQTKRKAKQEAPSVEKSTSEDEGGGGHSHLEASDDDNDDDHSVEKKPMKVQKSADVKPAYNKKAEHLKKVIKACGLNIPPAIYKRVKQAPESKRDSFLIKELEEVLSREGLSSNPTEKEIRAVKRRRDREKDLEGIDTTNIILEPRGRRAAAGWFGPPKYAQPADEDRSDEEGDFCIGSGGNGSNQEDVLSETGEENGEENDE